MDPNEHHSSILSSAAPEGPSSGLPLPPGPPGKLDLGAAERDPLQFILHLTSKYGDIVRYETAYGASYIVNSPEHIGRVFQDPNYIRGSLLKAVLGEGLLASEGKYWQRQRKMMQPDFHQKRIAGFTSVITDATSEMLVRWRKSAASGEPIDVAAEMARLTLDIIITALFSGDLRADADTLREAVTALMVDVGALVCTEFGAPLKLSPTRNARFRETLATIDRIVYAAIRERRQRGSDGADLLSVLLEERSDEGEGLDDRQVRDEVVTLVFAGSETSSMMLGWTCHLLGVHPDADSRVHSEASVVLGERPAQFEDAANLKFTRMVIEESLRLHPPVWVIFRRASADAELGGYRVTANAKVIVSPYAMHRNPRFWPDPERFDPERFSPQLSDARSRYAHLPFGGGRHVCIGTGFAMLEGQIVIAMIAQKYRLHLVPGHKVEPEPLVTLRQRNGILATLEPR